MVLSYRLQYVCLLVVHVLGSCEACMAYAAAAHVESLHRIAGASNVSLSAQGEQILGLKFSQPPSSTSCVCRLWFRYADYLIAITVLRIIVISSTRADIMQEYN